MLNREYPRLEINVDSLYDNATAIVEKCAKKGIKVAGVVKGFNGDIVCAKALVDAGVEQLASSRLEHLDRLKGSGLDAKYMLIRIPMLSEAEAVAQIADISLQSEISVIEAINAECEKRAKCHEVILMADLGDLREGYWSEKELTDVAEYIEKNLDNIKIVGVGTNLGCYGSIKPTVEKMNDLVSVAEKVEERIGRKLDIISGGATTSMYLVLNGTMPERINHLRVGEGIMLMTYMDGLWNPEENNIHRDVFTFKAEIIEVKEKASYPQGEITVDCFGNVAEYEDIGIRKRALAGAGVFDYMNYENLHPRNKEIRLIGNSSDHLIMDVTECREEIKVGDIVEFDLDYSSVLFLSDAGYVKKVLVRNE